MRITTKFLALAGLVIGIGGDATAQAPGAGAAPRAPQGGPPVRVMLPRGPGNVTAILNARRALDLTPRQVAQLDSIERVLHTERQRVAERARPAMDSLRQRMRTDAPLEERQRAELRAQAEQRREAMRPEMERLRQRDSVASAAADRILTDTQRAKWREMQAERRGYERGMREGRGRGGMQGRPPMGREMEVRRQMETRRQIRRGDEAPQGAPSRRP